jgi:Ca2+-binding EF-hand superfamily protein
MINGVSSMGASMAMMRNSGMKGPPPPPKDADVFQTADSDGDGILCTSELSTLVEGIEKVTGNSINVDDALSTYDADQDGGLSGEELLQMMTDSGFAPPEMSGAEESEGGMKPPPPPPAEQVLAAYGQNSGDNQIAQLLELLQNSESEEEYAPLSVTS